MSWLEALLAFILGFIVGGLFIQQFIFGWLQHLSRQLFAETGKGLEISHRSRGGSDV